MSLLLAVLVALGLVIARVRRSGLSAAATEPADRWVIIAILVLPVLYASAVLWQSRERLDALHLTYVGKRLAWGAGIPLTAGGADPESDAAEDLRASLLGSRVLRIEAVDAPKADNPEGASEKAPVLRLAAPAPLVSVDGEALNLVSLEDGDRIRLRPPGGSDPGDIELAFKRGALGRDGRSHELPGALSRFLHPGRVVFLPDVLADLAPELDEPARRRFYSLLLYQGGRWHLGLRDATVQVLRGEREVTDLAAAHPLPMVFELTLQVVRGDVGARRLSTVRRDRLAFGDEAVEVRFAEPQRRLIPLAGVRDPLELGLVVPSSIDRRSALIQLGERSPRFHGLTATLRYEPSTETASLEYLGGPKQTRRGELYALGEGKDLMLVRVERNRFPLHLLWELCLLALFFWVFLGRALQNSPALTAVVAPVAWLLAGRLLFSFRAATQPPDFFLRGYGEARLALWLVPALVLFGWSVGVVLRRLGQAPSAAAGDSPGWQPSLRRGLRHLHWPLTGLGVAAVACFLTLRGVGQLRLMGFLPLVLGVVLLALYVWAAGPGATRVGGWNAKGWSWPLWALAAVGLGILVVRGLGVVLGMPEALRLLPSDFRLLWTVLQLPVVALAVGLTAHRLEERRRHGSHVPNGDGPRRLLRDWIAGVCAFGILLALAFGLIGWWAEDTGLPLVHALSVVFVLVLLVAWPRELRRAGRKSQAGYAAGILLALLPLGLFLVANLMPQGLMGAVDRWRALTGSETGVAEDSTPARLRATPSQQIFRLYMLDEPERLREVGLRPSERVAIQYETLQSYGRNAGWIGDGFHSSQLPRHLGATYLNDLMPMAFVLADFGKLGMLALALAYLAVLVAAVPVHRRAGDRWGRQGAWVATVALLAFALPGVYMVLANLNLVLFTGKNCALLALNSVSDVLESGALLGLVAWALALVEEGGA